MGVTRPERVELCQMAQTGSTSIVEVFDAVRGHGVATSAEPQLPPGLADAELGASVALELMAVQN